MERAMEANMAVAMESRRRVWREIWAPVRQGESSLPVISLEGELSLLSRRRQSKVGARARQWMPRLSSSWLGPKGKK